MRLYTSLVAQKSWKVGNEMVRIRLLELNELGGGLEIKHMKYIGDDIFRKTRQFIY